MSQTNRCSVLRCSGDPAGTVPLAQPISITGERETLSAIVCAEHKALIDAGRPWKYEPDPVEPQRGSLLMGADFDAAGIYVTDVLAVREDGYDNRPDSSSTVTAVVEKLNSDGSREPLQLFLSDALIEKLRGR
jgi:hypothetical protein